MLGSHWCVFSRLLVIFLLITFFVNIWLNESTLLESSLHEESILQEDRNLWHPINIYWMGCELVCNWMAEIMRWRWDSKPVLKIFNSLGSWLSDYNEEGENVVQSNVRSLTREEVICLDQPPKIIKRQYVTSHLCPSMQGSANGKR